MSENLDKPLPFSHLYCFPATTPGLAMLVSAQKSKYSKRNTGGDTTGGVQGGKQNETINSMTFSFLY